MWYPTSSTKIITAFLMGLILSCTTQEAKQECMDNGGNWRTATKALFVCRDGNKTVVSLDGKPCDIMQYHYCDTQHSTSNPRHTHKDKTLEEILEER